MSQMLPEKKAPMPLTKCEYAIDTELVCYPGSTTLKKSENFNLEHLLE